jgi:hypothetical protein
MTEHPASDPSTAPAAAPSSVPGAPVDDRRADPPAPASATSDGDVAATEAQREAQETIRSISRLEESN